MRKLSSGGRGKNLLRSQRAATEAQLWVLAPGFLRPTPSEGPFCLGFRFKAHILILSTAAQSTICCSTKLRNYNHIIMAIIYRWALCTRSCAECFIQTMSLNGHKYFIWEEQLSPFYGWGSWGAKIVTCPKTYPKVCTWRICDSWLSDLKVPSTDHSTPTALNVPFLPGLSSSPWQPHNARLSYCLSF